MARTTSAKGAAAARSAARVEQLADAQPVGTDAVHRRDGAVEDVVTAAEGAGPLEGEDVERLLDHAQPVVVARGSRQIGQSGPVADVEAALAEDDLVAHGDERRREGTRLAVGRAQQVVGQPLGGLGPDAGQAREGLDQPGDRLDGGLEQRSRLEPRARACAGRR